MSTYRTHAFVLRRFDVGEKDAIVHIYGPTKGLQSLISKSTRNIKSKLRPFLEPFREVDIMIARGKGSERLVSVSTKCLYKNIVSSVARTYLAYHIMENVLHMHEDNTHSKQIYNIMKDAFLALDNPSFDPIRDGFIILNMCYLKTLHILGIRPETEFCCVCHEPIVSMCEFHPSHGGVVHAECIRLSHHTRYILEENLLIEIQNLRKIAENSNLSDFANLVYTNKEQESLYHILSEYWQFRLERPVRTREMIQLVCQT